MSVTREIRILLTHKNLLLVKKKINAEGELRFFIPHIPLNNSEQPVRVLHSKFSHIYQEVEMNLKNFFGKVTLRSKQKAGLTKEIFPYHIDLVNQKNIDILYEFLKKFNIDPLQFINFRWFDLNQKDHSFFTEEDKKIVDDLSYKVIYGDLVLKNSALKKLVQAKRYLRKKTKNILH